MLSERVLPHPIPLFNLQADNGAGTLEVVVPHQLSLKELKSRIRSGVKEQLDVDDLPLSAIDDENEINDSQNVSDLVASLKERGQIEPMTIAPYLTEKNEIRYRIINGFHRKEGLQKAGISTAKAILVLGCTEEELFDLRVGAATHEAVKYPRMVTWISESFKLSEWARKGITLRQMCGLGFQSEAFLKKRKKGKAHTFRKTDEMASNIRLTAAEVQRAQNWIIRKADVWRKPLQALYNMALLLEDTSLDLIAKVRKDSGSKKQKGGYINLEQLKAVVFTLPKNIPLQQRIVEIILDQRISAGKAKILAEMVAVKTDPEEIEDILKNPLEAIALAVVETPKPPVLPKKAVLYEGEADAERAELQRRLDDTEQKLVLAQQTIQQLEEKGKQNNGKEVKEGDSKLQIKTLQSQRDEAQRQAQDVQQKLTKLQEKVSLYERRIPVLETAFESVESLQEKIRILEEEKRELGDKLKAAKEEIKGIKSKPKNTGNSKKR